MRARVFGFALIVAMLAPLAVNAQDAPRGRGALGRATQGHPVEPFQVFDELYYVGIDWVGAWVIKTSDGLILIDSLYGEFVDTLFANMKKMGLDPKDVKYVFVTHAHYDHDGGAKKIKDISGAKIGFSDEDWKGIDTQRATSRDPLPERDLVIKDGDSIKLGDTTIKFYVTPGHTVGTISMEFTVHDKGKPYKAFMFGGVALNFTGVKRTEQYIASVKRIQGMSGIEVNIPNHASMGKVFEREEKLKTRREGEPHPFVAPEEYKNWLVGLLADAEKKLVQERDAVDGPK